MTGQADQCNTLYHLTIEASTKSKPAALMCRTVTKDGLTLPCLNELDHSTTEAEHENTGVYKVTHSISVDEFRKVVLGQCVGPHDRRGRP